MESGTNNKKLKVVWLCHFANQEIKDYFNTPGVHTFAPWISNLIGLFKSQSTIELHIVAPNIFNYTNSNFTKNDIHYHFYSLRFFLFPQKVNTLFRLIFGSNYHYIGSKISKIILKINPDIIHLHGAENPYYSSGIIPLLKKYPILLTIQGYVRNSSTNNRKEKKRIEMEDLIMKQIYHFGTRTKEMSEIALSMNSKANLHFHNYTVTIPDMIKDGRPSSYDIVFFARVCKDKGIEDLLQALSLVKKEKADISLHIIGPVSESYKQHLKSMIKLLAIETNVVWVGFLDDQQDIYKHAVNAEICVLPTHHDIIPGTIVESMYMKLPVIAYAVGGIPELNNTEERIILVEKNNIPQLAEKIILLLNNPDLRKALSESSFQYAPALIGINNIVPDILKAYGLILGKDLQ